jgi:hypothetical protein
VKVNSKALIYRKELNAIIGIAEVGKIKSEKIENLTHFFAYYKNYKKFKEPLFCDEIIEIIEIKLDKKLPGIIPISKEKFESLEKLGNI